jgi:fumarate reductase flavoprotein subunit
VWDIFDERIAVIARQFEDFRTAESSGALIRANSRDELASAIGVPAEAFAAEWDAVEAAKADDSWDRFGRKFMPSQKLTPPYCAVMVTGALFHTQGGLAVDTAARVLRKDRSAFPNLFAAGGAAAGVSGETAAGYLSGNGLLTATTLGRIAGRGAARLAAIS